MELTIKNTPEGIVAVLCGNLDTLAAEQVEPQIKELESSTDLPLTLDCTGLDYISSSGLRILLRLRKAYAAKGMMVTLLNVNGNIMDVLHVTHFDKLFIIK